MMIRPVLWDIPMESAPFLLKNKLIYDKMHVKIMSKLLRSP